MEDFMNLGYRGKVLRLIAFCSLLLAPAILSAQVSPFLKIGPRAIPVEIAGPNYGVFRCQVDNLITSQTCYDPYQMRHAYHVDSLISAGLDGRGKTIVIIDAFQSPNLVGALNTYNAFYGLPSLNGLGAPVNGNLGKFTQIAPDGLTPFIT